LFSSQSKGRPSSIHRGKRFLSLLKVDNAPLSREVKIPFCFLIPFSLQREGKPFTVFFFFVFFFCGAPPFFLFVGPTTFSASCFHLFFWSFSPGFSCFSRCPLFCFSEGSFFFSGFHFVFCFFLIPFSGSGPRRIKNPEALLSSRRLRCPPFLCFAQLVPFFPKASACWHLGPSSPFPKSALISYRCKVIFKTPPSTRLFLSPILFFFLPSGMKSVFPGARGEGIPSLFPPPDGISPLPRGHQSAFPLNYRFFFPLRSMRFFLYLFFSFIWRFFFHVCTLFSFPSEGKNPFDPSLVAS